MRLLYGRLSSDQRDTYSLVLQSMAIAHQLDHDASGWAIWVSEADYREAIRVIRLFEEENEMASVSEKRRPDPLPHSSAAWVLPLVLFMFHLVFASLAASDAYLRSYSSSAWHIQRGEWYRVVTALMIHGDTAHLLGNLVAMAIFSSGVCALAGGGLGSLLILSSGALGNLANAYFRPDNHVSIGASTAVFGAVGLLTALQYRAKHRQSGGRLRALLPAGAGLALLGFLGTGEHTDIMAHFWGFGSGLLLGLAYPRLFKRWVSRGCQRAAWCLGGAILALCWLIPLLGR